MSTNERDYQRPAPARKQQARRLRREQSPAEKHLWRALRACIPLRGTHFRRQVVIGDYIADFCAHGLKLIIEVDGEQHGEDAARRHDARRDLFLTQAGYRVLRFSARVVVKETDSVLDTIGAAVADRFRRRDDPTPDPSP